VESQNWKLPSGSESHLFSSVARTKKSLWLSVAEYLKDIRVNALSSPGPVGKWSTAMTRWPLHSFKDNSVTVMLISISCSSPTATWSNLSSVMPNAARGWEDSQILTHISTFKKRLRTINIWKLEYHDIKWPFKTFHNSYSCEDWSESWKYSKFEFKHQMKENIY
jgi:hypothetical protein